MPNQVHSSQDEALRWINNQSRASSSYLRYSAFYSPTCSYSIVVQQVTEAITGSGKIMQFCNAGDNVDLLVGPPDWIVNNSGLVSPKTVVMTMHEATRLPKEAVEVLNRAQAVIVPSTWGASCMSAQGVNVKIHVVPLGYAEHVPSSEPSDDIVFGAVSLTDPSRKCLMETVTAFTMLQDPDIQLWIRCREGDVHPTNDPRITFFHTWMPDVEYRAWIGKITFGVMPSAAEGFGLVHLEMSAAGIPVLYCPFSAVNDFMPRRPELMIDGRLMGSSGRNEGQGLWFRPSIPSLRDKMSEAINIASNTMRYLELAYSVRKAVEHLTWEAFAKRLVNVLQYEGFYQ